MKNIYIYGLPCCEPYLNIKAGNVVDLCMIKSSRELQEEEEEEKGYKKEAINNFFLYLCLDYYIIGIPRGMILAIMNLKNVTHFFP